MSKVVCEDWRCGWHGQLDEILRAKHPFDADDEILGCPSCKDVNCILNACDEDGCWERVTCGTPTKTGYRNTCGKHKPPPEEPNQ